MGRFTVDKDMVPMKGHFFLFNAGTAPLVPYLPTYAKQLGFSTYMVGIIYTFLPIFGLIAKPLFGAIADRFQKHKFIFILFQVITILAFSGLYFIEEVPNHPEVHLSCGNGETFFHICSKDNNTVNECTASKNSVMNETVQCDMSCSIDKPSMWQTICKDWEIPQYCLNMSTDGRSSNFNLVLSQELYELKNNCLFYKVSSDVPCTENLDSLMYANCSRTCGNVTKILNDNHHLVCKDNVHHLRICNIGDDWSRMVNNHMDCNIHCTQNDFQKVSHVCVNTQNEGVSCSRANVQEPTTFNFTGIIPLDKTLFEDQCVYFKLYKVLLNDGSYHYPVCSTEVTYHEHFNSQCKIKCKNAEVNNLLSSATVSGQSDPNNQLWIFFLLMGLNWIGMAVVVSIADAICFEKLGENIEKYGQQRLWGSAGWGIFSLLTGYLIDVISGSHSSKNYLVAFILMAVFLCLDVVVSLKLKYQQKKMSINMFHKVGSLFTNLQTCHFFIWIVLVGMCTGLLWQFLFWYLEDLSGCAQSDWIKTLQGFVSGIQCFLGEIPFLFFSGKILKKIGHFHAMSLVLLAFGIRFILYSVLENPWWVLPIELLQGLTFGIMYANMASYASIIAPDGTEATMQGLVGAVFEGVGTSLGSLTGGMLYEKLGGGTTFRIYGCVALGACLLNVVLSYFFLKVKNNAEHRTDREYSSIIHYAAPNDAIDLLNEN